MKLSRKERRLAAVEEQGLGPFISRRIYRLYDGSRRAWQSRHHRKGLRVFEPLEVLPLPVLIRLGLWRPRDLNWWIGTIFAFGSALFAAGCVRAIGTSLGRLQSLDPNLIFFAGSIPFTAAAYLQLFQAANAADPPRRTA